MVQILPWILCRYEAGEREGGQLLLQNFAVQLISHLGSRSSQDPSC